MGHALNALLCLYMHIQLLRQEDVTAEEAASQVGSNHSNEGALQLAGGTD